MGYTPCWQSLAVALGRVLATGLSTSGATDRICHAIAKWCAGATNYPRADRLMAEYRADVQEVVVVALRA
jgi:hypothetical protein